MTTLEMEVAIMDFLNPYNDVIVPNVSHGLLRYEADIVKLTSSGYATEIEIKTSKADFNADFKKKRFHDSSLFKYFYYAVPKELVEYVLPRLPERAGLYSVEPCVYQYRERGKLYEEAGYKVIEVIAPKVNPLHRKWKESEQAKLVRLGCMRILTLKINLLRMSKKNV